MFVYLLLFAMVILVSLNPKIKEKRDKDLSPEEAVKNYISQKLKSGELNHDQAISIYGPMLDEVSRDPSKLSSSS